MTSFFFNITDRKHKRTTLQRGSYGYLDRVDISNGIVFVEGKLADTAATVPLKNLDRLILIVMAKKRKNSYPRPHIRCAGECV